MMIPWIDIAIEGLVAVLLVLTIGYCILLDRRLQRLRADEANLRATISELLTATEIAERAILGLKETASDCDKSLAQRLREAEFFSREIEKEIGEGEKLLNRIIRITQAARGTALDEPASEPRATRAAVAPAPVAAEAEVRTASRLGDLRARVSEATARLGQMKRHQTGEAA
ncbi:DUF6468 domain-containing protein [Pinisolibacter sp.]|uniref:DUF6468 domain-containing protein n=1 Tax=Pinisolibacter sp. TaxID=2172024 RepID=UPI002FDE716F